GGEPAELERLVAEPFPAVFVGRREIPGGADYAYVGADYASATAEVIDLFADLGHTRVAYFGWPDSDEPTVDRRRVDNAGLGRRGQPADPALAHQLADHEVTADLLAGLRNQGATALLAQDDLIAERVLAHAHDLGLAVPDDLSIAVL